jgi:molybdopterin converting factor small subunit
MNVTVRFSGPLRALAGHRSLNLRSTRSHLARSTVCAARYGLLQFVQQVLTPLETNDYPYVLVLLNRVHLRAPSELERTLSEGDVIAFVPPMAGG